MDNTSKGYDEYDFYGNQTEEISFVSSLGVLL